METVSIVRRLVPLVLALAVGSAPIAFELCQIACESGGQMTEAHGAHHQAAGTHATPPHSCHHSAASAPIASRHVEGIPHACGHSDDLPSGLSPLAQLTLHAPAVLMQAFVPSPSTQVTSSARRTTAARVPIGIPLSTPLRL